MPPTAGEDADECDDELLGAPRAEVQKVVMMELKIAPSDSGRSR